MRGADQSEGFSNLLVVLLLEFFGDAKVGGFQVTLNREHILGIILRILMSREMEWMGKYWESGEGILCRLS